MSDLGLRYAYEICFPRLTNSVKFPSLPSSVILGRVQLEISYTQFWLYALSLATFSLDAFMCASTAIPNPPCSLLLRNESPALKASNGAWSQIEAADGVEAPGATRGGEATMI